MWALMICLESAVPLLAAAGCPTVPAIKLRVHFAGENARDALLQSTWPAGLQLLDLAGHTLWSAGPGIGTTQRFADMNAGIGTSLTAIDLDANGIQDRIYAGDTAGHLWRLDLRSGATRNNWMQATMLANFAVPGGGRGFVAAPDVARIATAGASWLSIAIGTASIGVPRADNRFYVLHDALAAAVASPLTENDLAPVTSLAGIGPGNVAGYYLPLGSAQVLAPSLTLNGRIYFTAIESSRRVVAACPGEIEPIPVPLSATVIDARDGSIAPSEDEASHPGQAAQHNLRHPIGNQPANAGVELNALAAADGQLACHVGAEILPECFLDTRPRRIWWRREDAD